MLVNERIDVALAAGADGVHLPSNGIEPADARRLLGPDKLIGVSTHQPSEIARAASQGADFAVFGPVFAPISKGAYAAPCGRDGLAAVCRDAPIPVFALGGITAARVSELAGAGAHGVALIGTVMGADDPAAAVHELLEALRPW
jgi:thiamine-phosphate pyrophosphorylase